MHINSSLDFAIKNVNFTITCSHDMKNNKSVGSPVYFDETSQEWKSTGLSLNAD